MKHSHLFLFADDTRKYLPYLTVTLFKKIFNAFLLGIFNGTYISMRQNASYSDSAPNFPQFTLTTSSMVHLSKLLTAIVISVF